VTSGLLYRLVLRFIAEADKDREDIFAEAVAAIKRSEDILAEYRVRRARDIEDSHP
jgi:hypothetical protein